MSEEIGRISEEDKFLGVRTTITPSSDTSTSAQVDEIDVEVVDDRPEDDRRPAGVATSSDDDMADRRHEATSCSTPRTLRRV